MMQKGPTQTCLASSPAGPALQGNPIHNEDTHENVWRARERLRRLYRPSRVRILFVGESPPASGRFFYRADSGLYRAMRDTFVTAFPFLSKTRFLDSFRSLGCYLVDLCGQPVDHMPRDARQYACRSGEIRLARMIRRLNPKIMVAIVKSIGVNVRRAQDGAGWSGPYLELPYPGRWHRQRIEFERRLVPLLREMLVRSPIPPK